MCTIRSRQTGFTLLELIFFVVVVAVGIAGILMVMDVSVARSADPMVRKQTVAIAESLMEEILLKEFANPVGGYTGATRALFDDVADYAGYSTAGGMRDILGNAIPALARYDVSNVAVVPTVIGGVNLLQVDVTVTGPGGAFALRGFRGNY